MSAPRTFRIADSNKDSRSRPLKRTLPRAMRPGGWTRRMIDSAVTDLPLPDSPTRPSVSPARISKLTSSTAGTGPRAVSNTVVRCETVRRGAAINRRPLHRGRVLVLAEHAAHCVGDLAERGPGLDGRDYRRNEIRAVSRGPGDRVEGRPAVRRGPSGAHGAGAREPP